MIAEEPGGDEVAAETREAAAERARPRENETTLDRFLDGRVVIEQPARGRHRAGLDAILLAATVPATATGVLVDLGAGVGTAGLAAAVRAEGLRVRLTERDPVALALAHANVERAEKAGAGGRVEVIAVDLMARGRAREAVLARESADFVVTNPPFWTAREVRSSPAAGRAAAHVFTDGTLDDWVRVAAATLKPHGVLSLIFRGDGLGEIVAALDGRFGAAAIRPIHPRADAAAHRLLVVAVKGSRARPRIVPGLVLHPPQGNDYLADADAVLRGRADLADVDDDGR